MEIMEKIVDFEFCKTCKNCDLSEHSDICNECLDQPSKLNSKIPVNYKEDEEKIKKLLKEKEVSNKEN